MLIDAVKEGDCRSITVALNAGEEADGNPTAGKKPIHYAVESGSEEAVALLCDRGANLEVGNTENLGRKPLHMAVQRGNFEVVQTLLEKNADPNAKDDIGKTPLIIAAAGNAGHIASLLLDKGADVNIKDSDGGGLLHLAARTGSPYILEILKGKGCEMDGRDKEECTPLHRAAEYGNLEAVKWFVNNGSDFNAVDKSNLTPLQKAQKEEFVDVVHWMKEYKKNEAMNKIVKALRRGDQRAIEEKISEGFDVNTILQEENELDGSPLHFAADEGHTSIAAFLLNHGPNVDCKNSKGLTPLHLAAWGGHTEFIKLLFAKNCNTRATTNEGLTAIHLASRGGHLEAIEAMAPHCDVTALTHEQKSALHLAAEFGNVNVVEWLLKQDDISIYQEDTSGRTAVYYAQNEGHREVAATLRRHLPQDQLQLHEAGVTGDLEVLKDKISKGINLEIPDPENGRLIIHTAALHGHHDAIHELFKAGVSKDATDKGGLQAIHYASRGGHLETLQFLQRTNCDLGAITADGFTALHFAAEEGHIEVMKWLVEMGGLDPSYISNTSLAPVDVARQCGRLGAAIYLLEVLLGESEAKNQDLKSQLKDKEKKLQKSEVNEVLLFSIFLV
ncbi:ankyrin-1 isoform X2 [Penaeus vannamei]|uniref:ankyrin-1 isoform X2 n=1 Tax=Penaeus vannamei TaxID=6689 RepID=UPI00387F5764